MATHKSQVGEYSTPLPYSRNIRDRILNNGGFGITSRLLATGVYERIR
jgi:hypothetical protein